MNERECNEWTTRQNMFALCMLKIRSGCLATYENRDGFPLCGSHHYLVWNGPPTSCHHNNVDCSHCGVNVGKGSFWVCSTCLPTATRCCICNKCIQSGAELYHEKTIDDQHKHIFVPVGCEAENSSKRCNICNGELNLSRECPICSINKCLAKSDHTSMGHCGRSPKPRRK